MSGISRKSSKRGDSVSISLSSCLGVSKGEGWRGGMEGWGDGGMDGWMAGGMEGWRDGGMEGRPEGWRAGEIGAEREGGMGDRYGVEVGELERAGRGNIQYLVILIPQSFPNRRAPNQWNKNPKFFAISPEKLP
jgi:hypothetical protein